MKKKILLIAASLAAVCAQAQKSQVATEIAPYVYPMNAPASPPSFTYATDAGGGYLLLSDDGHTIDRYDIRTGKKIETVFDVNNTREVTLPAIEGFRFSPDGSKILVYTDREPVYRRSFTARYYVYEIRSRILMPLSERSQRQQAPVISPDGRMVAFVSGNNIHIRKLDYRSEVDVTTDGAPGAVINGVPDWVYEEEFTTSVSMTWAPDNLTLCYLKYNESSVPTYTLPIYQGTCAPKDQYALYPGTYSYKYPVAGEKNSIVTVHSYDVETRKTKDIALPDSKIEYITGIAYAGSPDRLMLPTLNRDQNRFELYCANPKSTVVKSVYTEESNAWIAPETYENITYQDDGFVINSTRSGYAALYQYTYAGALVRQLAGGEFDVTAYYGTDSRGNVYYQAASPTPMDRTIYCVDRKGVVTPVSPTSGTTDACFSPGMDYAMVQYSNADTPPVYTISTPDGKQVRMLEDNAEYAAKLPSHLKKEFFTMESEGYVLNGYILHNPLISAKQPVIMDQYSGPGSQQVLNRWKMDWQYYAADKGYVVVCVDGRGTGGRGREFSDVVYRRLGYYETIDQINAARYAASLPYADGSRIGICGWSYGGYETLMAASRPGNPYAAAVSIAPVTDWRFYDTVYAERYMLTPQQNEDGYRSSAPITCAGALSCPLLLMYGTADDNVHPANTLQYVSVLQSKGILCDMLAFPNMNHSIYGCNSRALVYARMISFFNQHLKHQPVVSR